MNKEQKLSLQVRKELPNYIRLIKINKEEITKGVIEGLSISSLRHKTNYTMVCERINEEHFSEVAFHLVHKLQNYVNGVIDDIRIEYTNLLLDNLNIALEENKELRNELEQLRSNFKLLIENQAIISDTFRAELAKAIKSKEEYVRFVELNYTRKITNSGKLFPTIK